MKTCTVVSNGGPPTEFQLPELGDPCTKCHERPSTQEVMVMVERPGGVAYLCDECTAHGQDIAPAVEWSTEPQEQDGDTVRTWLLAICQEFERTIEHREWLSAGSKGMNVPFHGDFVSAVRLPSVISKMRWWAREFRRVLGNEPPQTEVHHERHETCNAGGRGDERGGSNEQP